MTHAWSRILGLTASLVFASSVVAQSSTQPAGDDKRAENRSGLSEDADSSDPNAGSEDLKHNGEETPQGSHFIEMIMSRDKDGDEKLSENELHPGLKRMLFGASDRDFADVDTNGDGVLDRGEVQEMVRQRIGDAKGRAARSIAERRQLAQERANGDAAHDQRGGDSTATRPRRGLRSYVVQFTEFRMKSPVDPGTTAEEIVQSFEQMERDGDLDVVETVRLSALEQQESMAQFGRRVSVTVSASIPGPGRPKVRHTQQQQVGTMARVFPSRHEAGVLLKLSYEASRFDGEGAEDSPPDTVTVQFDTTLLLQPDEAMLVGGTSSATGSLLLVSIQAAANGSRTEPDH